METKIQKGSIMLFTLVILSMLLLVGVTVLASINSQTQSAIATDKSVIAFFVAESGAEIVLEAIYSGDYDASALSSLATNCDNGVLSGTLDAGDWEVTLYDSDGDALTSCSSTSWRDELDTIKADGNHANTLRSIRMSIEPVSGG